MVSACGLAETNGTKRWSCSHVTRAVGCDGERLLCIIALYDSLGCVMASCAADRIMGCYVKLLRAVLLA